MSRAAPSSPARGAAQRPFFGPHAQIGEDTVLTRNATVQPVASSGSAASSRGQRRRADGFGFAFDAAVPEHAEDLSGRHRPVGGRRRARANACVDRATLGETVVGEARRCDTWCRSAKREGRAAVDSCAQVGISGSAQRWHRSGARGQAGVQPHRHGDERPAPARPESRKMSPPASPWPANPRSRSRIGKRASIALQRLPSF